MNDDDTPTTEGDGAISVPEIIGDISTETDHSDGAVAIEQKGGSDLIHVTGKVDFKSIHLQPTTSSQSNSNLSPLVDIEADSELTASQLRRKYHLGGELRDDQLSASQLKARYARVISPDERRSRFSRLSVAVVVVVMAAELVIKCCRAAAYVIREALSLKLLALIYDDVRSRIHVSMIVMGVVVELLVVFIVLFLFIHRVLGYLLGVYLRSICDPDRMGIYAFHFDWVSLRVGLDQNMVVLHGFRWDNPALFKKTPYLLRINEVSLVIDAMSVYGAIVHGKSIKIPSIRIDQADIFVERYEEVRTSSVRSRCDGSMDDLTAATDSVQSSDRQLNDGMLNVFAAIGASNHKQQKEVIKASELRRFFRYAGKDSQLVARSILREVGSIGSSIERTFMHHFVALGRGGKKKRSKAAVVADSKARDCLPVDEGTGEDPDRLAWTDDGIDDDYQSDDDTAEGDCESGIGTESARLDEADNLLLEEDEDYDDGDEDEDEDGSGAEHLSGMNAEAPIEAFHPNAQGLDDRGDVGRSCQSIDLGFESPPPAAADNDDARQEDKVETVSSGRGYKLEIDQLDVYRVKLYAQDLLSTSHVDRSKASVITLKAFNMFRTDLTGRPSRQKGGYRRGLYLDEVVTRLVNRLLSELILHNSMTMMLILSSAAASNTTTAASSAVSSAGSIASLGAAQSSLLLSATASKVGRTASDTASKVGRTASDTASKVGRTASDTANKVGRTASDTAKVAVSRVNEIAKFGVFSSVSKLIKPGKRGSK